MFKKIISENGSLTADNRAWQTHVISNIEWNKLRHPISQQEWGRGIGRGAEAKNIQQTQRKNTNGFNYSKGFGLIWSVKGK